MNIPDHKYGDVVPPTLALIIWLLLFLALLAFDPAKERGTSRTLWVPVIWMFFLASRLPSQWLNYRGGGLAAQALQEGNWLDRIVWSFLILLAIGILFSRSFNWGEFFARNLALTAYIVLGLASVFWSDFAFIAFKRWFRDLGAYFMILVILSDPRPLEAVRTVLRRLAYVLISLSILLVKYYIGLSRAYDPWTGQVAFTGVTDAKNSLGALCMISGIFFFSDTVARWSERHEPRTRRILWVNYAYMVMTLWLLHHARSATSTVCLALGCLFIALAHSRMGRRHPGFLKLLGPASFMTYLFLVVLGMSGWLNALVGRNANFTDRTKIWKGLLDMHTSPVLGTGYGSFWLGDRLSYVWQNIGLINEAHNGYLEVYLDLGLIGLFLLACFLISSYRTVSKRLEPFTLLGPLSLAVWVAFVFHNVTEANIGHGILWMTLLIGGVAVPARVQDPAPENAPVEAVEAERGTSSAFEATGQW